MNDLGDGAVEIYICQDKANRLCGRIVWLKEPLNAQGGRSATAITPRKPCRTVRSAGCRCSAISPASPTAASTAAGSTIPRPASPTDAAIRLAQRDKLVVTGYLGMKFMGKSFTLDARSRRSSALRRNASGPADQQWRAPSRQRRPAACCRIPRGRSLLRDADDRRAAVRWRTKPHHGKSRDHQQDDRDKDNHAPLHPRPRNHNCQGRDAPAKATAAQPQRRRRRRPPRQLRQSPSPLRSLQIPSRNANSDPVPAAAAAAGSQQLRAQDNRSRTPRRPGRIECRRPRILRNEKSSGSIDPELFSFGR